MRILASLFFAFFAFSAFLQADTASGKYPLQVSIFTVKATPGSKMKSGTGKANVKEANAFTGLDFTYDCALPFLAYGLERPYPGVWKEKGKVLTIRVTQIGDESAKSECDLKVTPLPTVYAEKGGRLTPVSHSEFNEIQERAEKNAEQNESEKPGQPMPLKVSIVESMWAAQGKLRTGSGKGNVTEKGRTTGFEFSAHCADKALQKTSSADYVGRWADNKTKLVIAAPAPGNAETPTCDLEIETRQVVYVKSADGKLTEVPLAEYNKTRSKSSAKPKSKGQPKTQSKPQ